MAYRLPLRIEEGLSGLVLVDADGRTIAVAEVKPWHGVPEYQQPDVARANLERIAAAVNAAS